MLRHGYSQSLATGSVAAGGTIGILIPPSIVLVLYGILVDEDIGKLFIAGIIPGIVSVLSYMLIISAVARFNPKAAPRGERATWSERWKSMRDVWAVVALFMLVIGGIYLGVFTATEAGGIGSIGALMFAISRRRMGWHELFMSLYETACTTAILFMIAFGALILTNFIEVSGLPRDVLAWVSQLQVSPLVVILCIVLIYLLLGTILEGLGMIFLTVPIFAPLVSGLGFDLIWFGIIVVVVIEISLITPPVGLCLFVIQKMVPDLKLSTLIRGVAPFWIADIARLLLFVFFPGIVMFLPEIMG